MLQRYLLLWLTLLSLLAYVWPDFWAFLCGLAGSNQPAPISAGGFDPFVGTHQRGYLKPLIAVTMFSIGSLLPRDEIRQVLQRWPTVFGGTVIQYAAMPFLAYVVGHAFRLGPDALTGVIMVGCVPGAMASNILTLAARGNVSYSVSLTTSATLLSPLMVPLALWLTLGASQQQDPWDTFTTLLLLVVGPVLAGHLLCRSLGRAERIMKRIGPMAANLTILWIIAVVVGVNRERLAEVTLLLLLALLTVNLLGYSAGYLGGGLLRLPEAMRRALTLEVGMQNAGLGTVLVLDLFPDNPAAAIPTAAYTFGCMLTGTILAQIWSARSEATTQ